VNTDKHVADRELLEAAARAAGLPITGIYNVGNMGETIFVAQAAWNPLTDDGDALRLAVALRMNIVVKTLPHAVYVEVYNGQAQSVTEPLADVRFKVADEAAATRRAIVRAAAAMAPAPATAPAP
jgi:hypothetical protein